MRTFRVVSGLPDGVGVGATEVRVEFKRFPVDVVEYLRLHHVVTLGTSSFTGMPHADTVIFTNDDWRIYFFALEGSALLRNIEASHYASFTIDDYTTD